MLIYFVNLLISLKLKSWENSSINEIANYIPSDEDLNYPARLEQLAEKKSEATSADEFQFKTWYPSSLSFEVVSMFRTSRVHWFGSGSSGNLLCIKLSIQKASKLIAKRSTPMDG